MNLSKLIKGIVVLLVFFSMLCIGQNPCDHITCDTVCKEDDLWKQKYVDGECVLDEIIEKNSLECGCDPLKKEEYAVYDDLLEAGRYIFEKNYSKLGKIEVIVIEDHTCWCLRMRYLYGAVGTCDSVTEEMPALKQETFDDFEVKNVEPYPLDDSFNIDMPVLLLSEDKINELFEKDDTDWGDELYSKYDSKGIITLSRVGFNADMDQALVHVGVYSIHNFGIGYYVLLAKKDDVWEIQDVIEAWIS